MQKWLKKGFSHDLCYFGIDLAFKFRLFYTVWQGILWDVLQYLMISKYWSQ